VETGKGNDALDRRPKLADALAKARKAKAPVVVAKLSRLSRDVAFITVLGNRTNLADAQAKGVAANRQAADALAAKSLPPPKERVHRRPRPWRSLP
jgi:hypothetical protein